MAFKILCVAGARPNFMKIAPLLRAFDAHPAFEAKLVHTGQHYDDNLSKIFFDELQIPRPDRELEVGSGSHAKQTAEVMQRFDPVLAEEQPHGVLVVGDVNSTIACALVVAKFFRNEPFESTFGKRQRPLMIHVEAGLRSGDWDMPEEINRILTDSISDLLYVSDPAGMDNLRKEGVDEKRIEFVGNVMIDTLLAAKDKAMASPVLEDMGLEQGKFGLVTLHRPSNVDDPEMLRYILGTLDEIAKDFPLVFPVHPRTRARIDDAGIKLDEGKWIMAKPIGYLDFMKLTATAKVVLTDSGGIQEETTVLGVLSNNVWWNTERPVTVVEGTNFLAGTNREKILEGYKRVVAGEAAGRVPRFWDGKSATRIVEHMAKVLRVE